MSLDAIKQISEVEQQAEQMVIQARADARDIAADALRRGAEEQGKLISKVNQEIQKQLADAQEKGRLSAAKSAESAKAECEQVYAQAQSNMEAAISLIVGRVV